MNFKNKWVKSICILLFAYFILDILFMISDLPKFGSWLRQMPYMRNTGPILEVVIPVIESLLCVGLLLRGLTLWALYGVCAYLLLISGYLIWGFTSGVIVFVNPYHTFWPDPTWLQYAVFIIALAIFTFIAIIIVERTYNTRDNINSLRKKPAEVH